MKSYPSLSIAAQVLTAFALVVVIAGAAVGLDLYVLQGIERRLSDIVDAKAEALKRAARLDRTMAELRIVEKNLLLDVDEAAGSDSAARLQRARSRLAADLEALDGLPLTAQAQALVAEFRDEYADYLARLERVADLVAAERLADARALTFGEARLQAREAQAVLARLVAHKEASIAAARAASAREARNALWLTLALLILVVAVGALVSYFLSRQLRGQVGRLVEQTAAIAAGDLERPLAAGGATELGRLGAAIGEMQAALRRVRDEAAAEDRLKSGLARLSATMSGDPGLNELAAAAIAELARFLGAPVAALYVAAEPGAGGGEPSLALLGSWAYSERKRLSHRFALGEGLVGQCALERQPIRVSQVPEDYVRIRSGLGESPPRWIQVAPCLREERLIGVVELGLLAEPGGLEGRYLEAALPALALAIETARGRAALDDALGASRRLTEQLRVQQEELKASNEELEQQTELLKESEARLKQQREELQVSNEELEEKNQALEEQKRAIAEANRALDAKRGELQEKAAELGRASRYKSEFLANMSHELRTPLNSLLLLAGDLAENTAGNLHADQVEAARVIQRSGNDLLALINEILDLARIESGHAEVHPEPVPLADLARTLEQAFAPQAAAKGLALAVRLAPDLPERLTTDRRRLEQVLRNLLSNALKFTEHGGIEVEIGRPSEAGAPTGAGLDPQQTIAFSVADTGIGIPADKHEAIFEAFRQADGGTARRYGGTGLGLAISRDLAVLLGGEILLASGPGAGSRFTLLLPEVGGGDAATGAAPAPRQAEPPAPLASPARTARPAAPVADDRDDLAEADKRILIVDDDPTFAGLLRDHCRERGFKVVVAGTGEEGLRLAGELAPQGIILDIRLPGIDGWAVLERVKGDAATRHIPVHIVSVDDARSDALQLGAVGFLQKPVDRARLNAALERLEEVFERPVKDLLLIEDDAGLRAEVCKLLSSDDLRIREAGSAAEALVALERERFDCMILDLGLPDMTGLELLERLAQQESMEVPPVVVYTGRELERDEEQALRRYAESIIVKGAKSPERLLDETSLFLHRVVAAMPERARRMIADLHDHDRLFRGRRVLLVDDDMRNVFALTRLLEAKGIEVLKAEDGRHALEQLAAGEPPDLIIMDIMMPVMDGYETMRRIRAQPHLAKVPIIALTAKAMKEDRAHCIEAGADDYLAKPVDTERLFSMMRIWLYR